MARRVALAGLLPWGLAVFSACAPRGPAPIVPRTDPAAPAAPRCDEAARVDVLDHRVRLELDASPPRLEGTGTITVSARARTRAIRLDADRLAITRAAWGGRALAHASGPREVCVALDREVARGERVALDLAWGSLGPSATATTPAWRGDAVWAGYATPAWMPTVARASARATLHLTIDAPAELAVVASGVPGAITARGARAEHTFAVERPAPTFLFAFAAGRFAKAETQVGDERLSIHGASAASLGPILEATAATLRFLEGRLGARLPEGRYAQVVVPGDAAQEAVGLALVGDEHVRAFERDPREDWIFAHELAHQWFARAVPCADFADFWLNEGFATFVVAAAKEDRWGREAYERELALLRERSRKVTAAGKDAPLAPRPDAPRELDPPPPPRGIAYARGALVLDRLRRELGDEAFWRGLARWVAEAPVAGARTDDLRRALEAATGRDLAAFFARWVYAVAPDA